MYICFTWSKWNQINLICIYSSYVQWVQKVCLIHLKICKPAGHFIMIYYVSGALSQVYVLSVQPQSGNVIGSKVNTGWNSSGTFSAWLHFRFSGTWQVYSCIGMGSYVMVFVHARMCNFMCLASFMCRITGKRDRGCVSAWMVLFLLVVTTLKPVSWLFKMYVSNSEIAQK